ncbi:hypothetical protein M409DRAFT_61920 [Zasmidium cellare ATCC 36951]|uniref:PHD-type domain-containing protein n=1 Tax=Zasmidium cellare ATCC 36951 TaxID=1080233 RepID=A0A6A6D7E6_ZASCE|nr:uncharacterized protein M409DRAFT_61920 [Zasmidium cellare ATCC 36951]KAF2173556.1 hypothetical protein M409DRAFT_61920 [Zasmidium cellare ATCC 36951]
MPAPIPDIRNRRGLDERRSSSRGPMEASQRSQSKGVGKERAGQKNTLDGWVEPSLAAPKPSYQDHGAGPYGVLEHMQPLGEAPSAKVKARVKGEGPRKSVLGRSSAAVGLDAQETPESTPAPAPATPQPMDAPTQQPIVIDDDKDGDYAPNVNGKKKERSTRARAVKRKSESASSATPAAPSVKQEASTTIMNHKFEYDDEKLLRVVEAAKSRAYEVGKPDLAAAVHAVYELSLRDIGLRLLLEAILTQKATPEQNASFQDYVRAAKKKLKDEKKSKGSKTPVRQQPAANTNGSLHNTKTAPSPTINLTLPPQPHTGSETTSAIPSTEHPEPAKPRISLKVKSPNKDRHRRRTGNGNMSVSPRKRAGSAASDSSLTSLTSNDEMDLDEPEEPNSLLEGPPSRANGIKGKGHATDRTSLAVPGAATKRTSAEAELEEERDRAFAAKKQKLNESVARDFEYQESNVRPSRPPPRSRAARVRDDALGPPSLRLDPTSSRTASVRGSRAASMDVESSLSSMSPVPEKKQLAGLAGVSGAGGAGRDSPIGDDDNDVLSENNDFCSACHSSGYLLCCDGCDRSFHFTCLDPPISEDSQELDEPWYCYICVAKRPVTTQSPEKAQRGIFAQLISGLKKQNPANFSLPDDIRDYFEGVATDRNGGFVEALNVAKPTRNRPGYTEERPDWKRLRDNKGNLLLCYACGKTSEGKREIITCDHCAQNWHLDCLDPPLANPPALNAQNRRAHDWMCPLHADQELRKVDMSLLNRRNRRTIHLRKPKNPKVQETSLTRGHRNNGIIEVLDDESDASDSEFYDHDDGGTVYKLPAHGIKLDFIDKVKSTRVQQLRDQRAYKRARIDAETPIPTALEQANFAKRPFNEQQLALNLAQFASDNKDLDLGGDQVQNLVGTLIAEAPSAVVDEMMAAEDAEKAKSASSLVPPSPPSSEQTDQLSAEQRKELQMLQELIRRKLENSKT